MAAASSEPAAKKMRSTNYITVETRLFKFMIEKSVSGKFAIVDTEGQVHCSERVTDIAGMPWRMKLFVSSPHHFYTKECRVKLTSYISPIDAQLKIKVCCNWRNKSSLWACQACLEFNVWIGRHDTAKANKKIITKEFEKKFNRFITAETFTLIDWAELVDHKNSFVPSLSTNDSKFTEIELNVEMKVKIISLAGYSLPLTPDSTLCVRTFEGGPLTFLSVNSFTLAAYSEFFKGLFFGSFQNNSAIGQQEILEEDIENFETMLKLLDLDTVEKVSISVENGLLLTHCHVDFLVNSVEGLLRLADKYIVPNLQKKCLVFLLLLDEKHILLKLQLSDTYMLAELENQCLGWLSNGRMLEQLRSNIEGYSVLSDRTKLAILDSAVIYGGGKGGSKNKSGPRAFVVDQDGRVWPPTRSPSPSNH